MERIFNLHMEQLPEGVYLATSDEVQGLIAQGRTIPETVEIARDVAKKLTEAQHGKAPHLRGGAEQPVLPAHHEEHPHRQPSQALRLFDAAQK